MTQERNSEQKIAIAVIAVLAMKVLGLDVETVKSLLSQANDMLPVGNNVGASELGMIVVAAVYNWGRVTLKKGREALDV